MQALLDDLLEAVLGDSQLLVELVVGTALLDVFQEHAGRDGRRHGGGRGAGGGGSFGTGAWDSDVLARRRRIRLGLHEVGSLCGVGEESLIGA